MKWHNDIIMLNGLSLSSLKSSKYYSQAALKGEDRHNKEVNMYYFWTVGLMVHAICCF